MFADRLQELRKLRNISRAELAAGTRIAISSIGNYERNDRKPDSGVIIKFCDYFKVSSDYLLGLSDDPNRGPVSVSYLPDPIKKEASKLLDEVSLLLKHETEINYDRNIFELLTIILHELFEIITSADRIFEELEKKYPNFNRANPLGSAGVNVNDLAAAALGRDLKPELAQFLKEYYDIGFALSRELELLAIKVQQLIEVGACKVLTGGFIPDKVKK